MSNIVELKNSLRIRKHILYNKLSNTIMSKHPFNCSKCGKGCYIRTCASCIVDSGFIEDSIYASNNDIKYNKEKTIEQQQEKIKTEKKKILHNNNIMKIEDIIKIKLKPDNLKNPKCGKEPINGWTDKRNQSKNYKANPKYNIGIVCNEESGIFGVDLDFYSKEGKEPYDPINNQFHKEFIDRFGEDYVEYFNTYTQETPNGGKHLIFKHEEGLKQIQSDKYKIDTRGGDTNGYLVGFNSVVNGKKYEVILNKEIQPLPKELKDFLFNVVAVDSETNIKHPKQTKGTKLLKAVKDFDIKPNYKYNITDEDLFMICEKLPPVYFTDTIKFLTFTSAMKQIGRKDIWDIFSKKKPNYNKENNDKLWNITKNKNEQCSYFEFICNEANCKEYINLSKYKPIPEKQSKEDVLIDMPYLTGEILKWKATAPELKGMDMECYTYGFKYDNYDDIIIQSDTGTAKSSSFKEYMIKSNQKFVSIVSRISLAKEQHEDFSERIEGVDYYGYDIDNTHKGLIICIDSIMKINSWSDDWGGRQPELANRVVFLDEFNSLVEYVLQSSTMKNKRIEVFNFLVNEVFMKAKKIICADADISDISMKFIEYIKKKRNSFTYVRNKHIHNKGTPATELTSKCAMIDRLSKEKTFMCACDSKANAQDIYQELMKIDPKAVIKIIIARDDKRQGDDEYIDLKSHAKIIFSPKIVYGNDSNGYLGKHKRPVYAYYKEETISPTAMLQQINRERKISHLYYCFSWKRFMTSHFKTSKDVIKCIQEKQKIACDLIDNGYYTQEFEKMFIDLTADLYIKNDAYNTNKYAHFKSILPTRGFIDTKKKTPSGFNISDPIRKIKNIALFNKQHFKVADALNSQANLDIVGIFNTQLMIKNKSLFTDAGGIEKYILRKTFFLKDKKYCERKLKLENEIEFKKINSIYYKLQETMDLYDTLGFNKDLTKKEDYKDVLSDEEIKKIMQHYNGIKKLNLNDEYGRFQFIVKITKHIFGKNMITSKKKQIKGVRHRVYTINKNIIDNLKEIEEHKNIPKKIKPTSKVFTEYYMRYRNLKD